MERRACATLECETNALKNRGESDWFVHDRIATNNPVKAVARGNGHLKNSESTEWMTTTTNPPQQEIRTTNYQNTMVDDWYKHGSDVPDPPSLTAKKPSKRSSCDQMRPQHDTNDWFKHSPTTCGGAVVTNADSAQHNSRLISPEADSYYRRDKAGSATDWYSHDHQNANQVERKKKGTTPLSDRLKTNSENWFAPGEAPPGPATSQPGLTSSANRRNQSDNISQIINNYQS